MGRAARWLLPAPRRLSYSPSAQVKVLLTCRPRANGWNGSPAKWTSLESIISVATMGCSHQGSEKAAADNPGFLPLPPRYPLM